MNLSLDIRLAEGYSSPSQKVKNITEAWVAKQIFCPNCGNDEMDKYPNNRPVADFLCSNCREEYELKSKKNDIGASVVDGAYKTMIDRLQSSNNPSLFLLNYDARHLSVLNFLVIPKHYFIPDMIEKRKPLSKTARRAGWIGCNILLQNIPQAGKIFYVKNRVSESKASITANWQKTLFLREEKAVSSRGWLLDVMNCVEKLGKKNFSLDDIYAFTSQISKKHPENKHIKDKIRQQLQFLRDKGYLEFVSRGNYRLT
jgi:type II restriction enzyme